MIPKVPFLFTEAQFRTLHAGLLELPGKIGIPVLQELEQQYNEFVRRNAEAIAPPSEPPKANGAAHEPAAAPTSAA